MLLSQAAEQFLFHCRHIKQLSTHTLLAYERDLAEVQTFGGAGCEVFDCDRQFLHRYLHHLFEMRGLQPASVKRRLACLKSMFRWLELEDLIEENPFRKFKTQIRQPKQLPKGLSLNEVRQLMQSVVRAMRVPTRDGLTAETIRQLGAARGDYIELTTLVVIEVLFSTGIRVGELVGIRHQDLDLSTRTIRIRGKGSRERIVFLPKESTARLARDYQRIWSSRHEPNDALIRTSTGDAASTQYIRLLLRRAGERAGIDRRVTPHMFRHSAASQLLEAGMDIRYVQKLLGHQSILTTQIYTHVSDRQLKSSMRSKHPIKRLLTE